MQFWLANILSDEIAPKIKAAATMAPIMYLDHQTSLFVKLSMKHGIDKLLEKYFVSFLWLKKDYSIFNSVAMDIAPRFLQLVPRTFWKIVQTFTGFNDKLHVDLERVPMLAKNDVGGTSMKNIKHFMQVIGTKRFATLEREGQPMQDYPVEKLAKNLGDMDILMFVGPKDAFSQ